MEDLPEQPDSSRDCVIKVHKLGVEKYKELRTVYS